MATKTHYLDDMFQRVRNAESDFIAVIINIADCSEIDARKVMGVYLKNRLAKMDKQIGHINVVHGVFLERDVIQNAIDLEV